MDDEKKREGSGKSPTKFMERPGTTPKKEEPPEGHPEFINDDLDALENQEKQDEDQGTSQGGGQQQQGWSKPGRKGDQKPDPRKYQDPAKSTETDSSSEEKGGDAC